MNVKQMIVAMLAFVLILTILPARAAGEEWWPESRCWTPEELGADLYDGDRHCIRVNLLDTLDIQIASEIACENKSLRFPIQTVEGSNGLNYFIGVMRDASGSLVVPLESDLTILDCTYLIPITMDEGIMTLAINGLLIIDVINSTVDYFTSSASDVVLNETKMLGLSFYSQDCTYKLIELKADPELGECIMILNQQQPNCDKITDNNEHCRIDLPNFGKLLNGRDSTYVDYGDCKIVYIAFVSALRTHVCGPGGEALGSERHGG